MVRTSGFSRQRVKRASAEPDVMQSGKIDYMDERDWRLKVQVTLAQDAVLPWNGAKVFKGDQLNLVSLVTLPKNRILTIPVPDMTALYINSSAKAWEQYWDIRKQNRIDSSLKNEVSFSNEKQAFDALEGLTLSVISAFSAVESFCNDSIPNDHEYWHPRKSEIVLERSGKKELERYFSTENKLIDILPGIYNVGNPKGKSPVWESFKRLKACRDSLIHAKSSEVRSVGLDKKNLWNKLFVLGKPYLLAKDVFSWYLKNNEKQPLWFQKHPK